MDKIHSDRLSCIFTKSYKKEDKNAPVIDIKLIYHQ